jgi:hypothetical protein
LCAGLGAIGFVPLARISKFVQQRSEVGALALAILLCSAVTPYLFDEATEAFWQRATSADNATERITGSFLEPWKFLPVAGVIGYGAGATHPGGEALRLRLGLPALVAAPPAAEAETVRVLLELGAFGFFLWYALRLSLLWALWVTWTRLQTASLRHLALAAFLIHAIQISGSVVLNHTFGVYYWFSAGFIFLLPRLDAQMRAGGSHPVVRPGLRRWRRRFPTAQRRRGPVASPQTIPVSRR